MMSAWISGDYKTFYDLTFSKIVTSHQKNINIYYNQIRYYPQKKHKQSLKKVLNFEEWRKNFKKQLFILLN